MTSRPTGPAMLTRASRIISPSSSVRARRFATFGSVLALTAGSALFTIAHAQPTTAVTVNIRAQQLGTALTTFADQAGLRLLLPSGTVAGRTSPALSGTMTREEALSRLLAGTGLSWHFTQ